MKAFHILTAMVIATLAMSELHAAQIEPTSLVQSDCHQLTRGYWKSTARADISYNDGVLRLEAFDMEEFCEVDIQVTAITDIPGEIHFRVHYDGETDCICYYDVTCEYEGIAPGHYTVYFEYDLDHYMLRKEIDIEEGCQVALEVPSSVPTLPETEILSIRDRDILCVGGSGDTKIQIYDADGRHLRDLTVSAPAEISLSDLHPSLYIIRFRNQDHTETLRYLK